MHTAKLTLAAISSAVEAAQEDGHRTHLGASLIGRSCARQLWYVFHWAQRERHEARMLRLFNRGHHEEARFVSYLRDIGVEVWEVDPSNGKQWRISDVGGHFGGSLDAVGRGLPDLDPGEGFLCEFKTHNDKSFGKLKEDGLMRAKWEHFVQMQVYMTKMGLRYAAYFAVNKNDDELFVEIVENDGVEGPRAIARAESIIKAVMPPPRVNESAAHWACKFCHFNRLCQHGEAGAVERSCRTCEFGTPSTIPAADGEAVWLCKHISCMERLDAGRLNKAAQQAACHHHTVHPALREGRQP